jgi:osmotically-inducible protein OsmY
MRYARLSCRSLLLGTFVLALFAAEGCNIHQRPDDKAAVYQLFDQNGLSSVEVSQDRISGVITLKGDIANADRKARAEALARQAAPDYTISNQLHVDNSGIANPPQSSGAGAKKLPTDATAR